MIGEIEGHHLKDLLTREAEAHHLSYLAYQIIFPGGGQGYLIEVGKPASGTRQGQVQDRPRGRFELHWQGQDYSAQQAEALLGELERQGTPGPLSEHLHQSLCQTLTVAHLHLELILRSPAQAEEQLPVVRQHVEEANSTVRELIDALSGEFV
jgi:signal transduction histidine kinase